MKADFPCDESYAHAAWLLRCSPFALRAIAEVEAGTGGAFLDTDEPTILFERHIFDELTSGKYRSLALEHVAPEIARVSDPRGGGYGPVSLQHRKLALAAKWDWDAAMKSASWGLFQILGRNHVVAGYPSLRRFITAMYRDVEDHLRALVMFIRHDERLVDSIRGQDWGSFARVYNGPQFARNAYATKMASAYARLTQEAH